MLCNRAHLVALSVVLHQLDAFGEAALQRRAGDLPFCKLLISDARKLILADFEISRSPVVFDIIPDDAAKRNRPLHLVPPGQSLAVC